MGFEASPLGVSVGVDTIAGFTPATAGHMAAATWGTPPKPVSFVLQYVSLAQPFSLGDITIPKRDAILGQKLKLGLVQHVERPSWQANPGNGQQHGACAAAHAKSVEYPGGCHIGVDMEGLGDAGAPVLAYVRAWAKEVHAAGYLVAMYEGYDDGLTLALRAQLVTEGTVDVLWSDYGPRVDPPGIGFAMHQHPQQMLAGTQVDVDTAAPDLRGMEFVAMILGGDPANDDTDPAIQPVVDKIA